MKTLHTLPIIIDRQPAVRAYFRDISRYPILDRQQERRLAERMQQGDKQAMDQLINANLRYVVTVAVHYSNAFLQTIDLISEGNMGLMRAARTFDPSRGYRFITYAELWIRSAINEAIARFTHHIHLPQNKWKLQQRVFAFCADFEQRHCRQPQPEEVAAGMDISMQDATCVMQMAGNVTYLSTPVATDEGSVTLCDVLPSPDVTDTEQPASAEERQKTLLRILSTVLKPREREAVIHRFGIGCPPLSVRDTALLMGVTRQCVSRLQASALKKLREHLSPAPPKEG